MQLTHLSCQCQRVFVCEYLCVLPAYFAFSQDKLSQSSQYCQQHEMAKNMFAKKKKNMKEKKTTHLACLLAFVVVVVDLFCISINAALQTQHTLTDRPRTPQIKGNPRVRESTDQKVFGICCHCCCWFCLCDTQNTSDDKQLKKN